MAFPSLKKLTELDNLLTDCKNAEDQLNDKCYNLLKAGDPVGYKTKFGSHGYYIKRFLNQRNGYIEKQKDDDIDAVVARLNKTPQELIDLGIAWVMADLVTNAEKSKEKKYANFARGNRDEIKTFVGFYEMLNDIYKGQGFTIKDTAPKEFGDSVRYDMQITIPDQVIDEKTQSGFSINIENKTGITSDPYTSSFHFGTVSSGAIAGGTKAYETFLNQIQKISREYLEGLHASPEASIRDAKDKYLRELVVEYIKWKLNNNWPVFTSSQENGTILCSQVINAMKSGDMLSFDLAETEDVGDMIYSYVGSDQLKVSSIAYDEEAKIFRTSHVFLGDFFAAGDSSFSLTQVLDKVLKETLANDKIRVSPRFKMSLWYGKK